MRNLAPPRFAHPPVQPSLAAAVPGSPSTPPAHAAPFSLPFFPHPHPRGTTEPPPFPRQQPKTDPSSYHLNKKPALSPSRRCFYPTPQRLVHVEGRFAPVPSVSGTVAAAARKGTILDTIRPKDVQKQTIASVSLPGVNIAAAAEITPVELSFRVPSDITLRAKAWGKPPVEGKEMGGKRCILAIHGWLDNANSFDLAAPLLAAKGAYVVCLDLAGHGLSDHRQAHGGYYIWDMMDDILGVVDELNWPTFSLLGHSTGGHIAAFFTGTYPARVQRLIMLESIGTAIQFQGDPPAEMAAFIHRRREINKWGNSTRVYDSFEDAARARMNGFTKVNLEAARLLCERGLEPVVDDLPATPASSSSSSSTSPSAPQPHRRHPPIQGELRYIWRTDPRLTLWAFLHTPEALLLRFFKAIICPVAVIAAEGSTIWDLESSRFKARLDSFRHLTKVVVPGGHHMHMERECVGEVVKAMGEFLELEGSETA